MTWSKRTNYLLIVLFMIGIALPSVVIFVGDDQEISRHEKRRLTKFPNMSINTRFIEIFPRQFEAWFNDHFGFRETLIYMYNRLSLFLRVSPSQKVLVGRDGWLFYTGDHVLDDYRNSDLFSRDQLDQWLRIIKGKRDHLAASGVSYVFVVAPNKHTIYPEYLPLGIIKNKPTSRLDQLSNHLSQHGMKLVDLRAVLLEAKLSGRLYHKTDSHWNHRGVAVAHKGILSALYAHFAEELLGGTPQLIFKDKLDDVGGDLSIMLGFQKEMPEIRPMPRWKGGRCAKKINTILAMDLKLPHKPMAFECSKRKLRVLVFHDSFGNALIPHLAENFGYSLFVRTKPGVSEMDKLLKDFQPDIVIEINVERSLRHPNSGAKEFL
jgi:hypothetical protein